MGTYALYAKGQLHPSQLRHKHHDNQESIDNPKRFPTLKRLHCKDNASQTILFSHISPDSLLLLCKGSTIATLQELSALEHISKWPPKITLTRAKVKQM